MGGYSTGGSGGGSSLTRSILSFTASASSNTTSASYVDISGMSNQTVTSMIAGTYMAEIRIPLFSNSALEAICQLSILVDGTTSYEVMPFTCSAVAYLQIGGWVSIPLTQGSHTFRPQVKKTGGGAAAVAWISGDIGQIVLL